MGIQNLFKLIKEFAPGAVEMMTLSELEGWRVGLDASMAIYQWCSIGQTRNIVNGKGKLINHIQGAFFRTSMLITAGIEVAYIFDGAPPKAKAGVITRRKESRNAGKSTRVPREVFAEVAKLLELMGVTIVQSPSEAEAQAARLTLNDSIDAVATEDMDAIAFGCRYMIRGLDSAAKTFTVIETEKVLESLGLSIDQFIDLCILLGCDYTGTLPGIGYKRALGLIKKYKSIEKILAGEKITPPANFDYQTARAEFKKPVVNEAKLDINLRKLTLDDINRLREFLIEIHGLEPRRVTKTLKKLAAHNGVTLI